MMPPASSFVLPQVRLHAQLAGHGAAVYTLLPGPAPGQVYSAGSDALVALWQAHTAASLGAVLRATAPVYALCHLTTPHSVLVAGQNDGGLHAVVWLPPTPVDANLHVDADPAAAQPTRHLLRSVQVHRRPVFALEARPQLPVFYSVAGDGCLGVWSLDPAAAQHPYGQLHCQRLLPLSPANLRALALSPCGQWLAVGASDGKIRLLALPALNAPPTDAPTLVAQWEAHVPAVFCLAFAPDGQTLYSAGRDAHLCAWHLPHVLAHTQPKAQQRVPAHTFAIHHLALCPDGHHLATASMDKSIKLWDAHTLRLRKVIDRRRLPAHASSVNRLCWLAPPQDAPPHTHLLASCSDDRQVLVWHIDFAP